VALGFVLIFRATSVVNFAQGEFSMVAAYLMVVFAVDLARHAAEQSARLEIDSLRRRQRLAARIMFDFGEIVAG